MSSSRESTAVLDTSRKTTVFSGWGLNLSTAPGRIVVTSSSATSAQAEVCRWRIKMMARDRGSERPVWTHRKRPGRQHLGRLGQNRSAHMATTSNARPWGFPARVGLCSAVNNRHSLALAVGRNPCCFENFIRRFGVDPDVLSSLTWARFGGGKTAASCCGLART